MHIYRFLGDTVKCMLPVSRRNCKVHVYRFLGATARCMSTGF